MDVKFLWSGTLDRARRFRRRHGLRQQARALVAWQTAVAARQRHRKSAQLARVLHLKKCAPRCLGGPCFTGVLSPPFFSFPIRYVQAWAT